MQHQCKCGKPAKYRNPKREQWWCKECYDKKYLKEKYPVNQTTQEVGK
jgi:hypothetical protein